MATATIQLNPMVMDWTGPTHAHKEYPSGFPPCRTSRGGARSGISHQNGRIS